MLKPSLQAALAWCLVASPFVCAETQYWVSVHSFQKEENAHRAVGKTATTLAETFRVVGASTSKGYFYRVASGPYLTREIAEEQVRTAQAAGYEGAWLWVDDALNFDQAIREPGADYAAGASDVDGYDPDYTTSYEFSDYDSDLGGGRVEDDPDLQLQRQPPPELVEDAPAGYQLNKLRRDG